MAASIDGRIGNQSIEGDMARQEGGLSSDADQSHLRQEISQADAIIVGASSIRANGECLHHPGRQGLPPTWYIFTTSPMPESYQFWQQHDIKRVLLSPKKIPIHDPEVELRMIKGDPAQFAYQQAKADGCQRTLLFGGGVINRWFYNEKLVDELVLTLAPKIVGQEGTPFLVEPQLHDGVTLRLLTSQVIENFVFLRYAVQK